MNTVFVYADGKVGLVALPDSMARLPNYRVPIARPFKVDFCANCADDPVPMDYQEFTRRGQMFDGRPILCAPGWDVKECRMTLLVTPEPDVVADADRQLRREVDRYVFHELSNAIELDRWLGDVPLSRAEQAEGLVRQTLRKRGTRVLVASPV